MAEENTTDLTPTQTDPSPAQEPSNSSTTGSPQTSDDKGDELAPTILTGEPDASDKAGDADKSGEADDKAGDADKGEDKSGDDQTAAFYGAPEGEYEISGLPEGMEIDKAALEAVTPIAKELNLSNEGFSKIAGVYAEKVLPAVQDQITEGIEREVVAKHAEWAEETKSMLAEDPVFKGVKLADAQRMAAKTLDRFFGEDMRTFLEQTGLGNHPAMVKGMYQIGTQIAEDTTFERGVQTSPPKRRTEKYYGPQS